MTNREVLREKLNLDTAKISWEELQRYFAAGHLIAVREGIDLVEVALSISSDERNAVEEWIASNAIGKVTDEEALSWHESKAVLWAVVVKPWVLVQEARVLQ
ncbi:MAG: DUF2288 domain-containing protein [Burkholderiales bacterium]|nr:DUF2288 domain-containing protein [Burkholderiales bacterium]